MEREIEKAKKLALQSCHKHKHAAFVLNKKGIVIAMAANFGKTHPIMLKLGGDLNKIYLHAEVAALLQAKKVHTLYSLRVNKQGKLLNAKPCKICQKAIQHFGVKEVYYSTNDGTFEKL